jgi:hypothetical protein
MIKFLKALFSSDTASEPSLAPETAATSDPGGANANSHDEVLASLIAHICTTMPDARSPEEIDPHIHMYDAGYVTSITAADLLAHIDAHYQLDISETKLIGPLQNLAALSKFICTERS